MLEHPTLPFGPGARATDPETSHAAAHPDRPTLRWRCLVALTTAGSAGLTDFELADRVDSIQTSAGKRRHELMVLGLVEDSGHRRLSPNGRAAIVWRAV